eukprot:278037-Alexandrium_andersonii.AAC.1
MACCATSCGDFRDSAATVATMTTTPKTSPWGPRPAEAVGTAAVTVPTAVATQLARAAALG